MFTQRISMDCTQEQYEKYLKEELEKMGYEIDVVDFRVPRECIIANNGADGNGRAISTKISSKEEYNRTYLGKFNANMFLALAAMTDKEYGGYREWWVCKREELSFGKGKLYNAVGLYSDKTPIFIDEERDENGFGIGRFFKVFRKATVSEIMAKFGEQPQKGKIEFEVTLDTKAISEQLDKGLKTLEYSAATVILQAQLNRFSKEIRELLDYDATNKRLDKIEQFISELPCENEVKSEPIKERMVYRPRRFEPPVIGELAIFWETGRKSSAVIGKLITNTNDGYVFYESGTRYDKRQFCLDNAILFESIEQYNEFIKS